MCSTQSKSNKSNVRKTHLSGVGRLDVRLQGHVGERHLHGVFDRVEQLHDHIADVLEAELPSLGGAEGGTDLKCVEQQRLEEINSGGPGEGRRLVTGG